MLSSKKKPLLLTLLIFIHLFTVFTQPPIISVVENVNFKRPVTPSKPPACWFYCPQPQWFNPETCGC